MASGKIIETTITTDVDGVIKGAEKVADSFEEIQDSLKDTAKAGDKAFEKMEDSADDAAKVIDRDLTKALDEVQDKAKSTGKTVGRNIKDGTDKAGEGFEELKSEAKGTATEAAASFGSIEDAADAVQEVLSQAFQGFGPAGVAAGLIAAAGVGLAISALQDHSEKVNENKERVIDMAKTIAENGGALRKADYIQAMEDYGYSIVDTKEWLDIFQEDAITGFEKMSQLSKDSGIDLKTAFDGAFGSSKDAEKGLEMVNKKLADLKEKKDAVYNTTGSILDPVDGKALTSLDELKVKMEENIRNQRVAEEMEKARRAAIEGTVDATLEDIAALEKKNSVLQDGVTSELDYRDQVAQTNATITENGRTLNINTQAGRDNQRALIDQSDAALQMAQSQLEAGVSADVVTANLGNQREALLRQLDVITGNRAESEKLAASMGLIPKEVITEVKTNGVAQTKTDIDTIPATKDTAVTVDDGGTSAATQKRVNSIEGRDIKVDVQDFNTARQTQDRINGLKGRDVKVDVQDFNTVRQTQDRINALKGKDVFINVKVGNEYQFQQEIARLTATASKTINVYSRETKDPLTP